MRMTSTSHWALRRCGRRRRVLLEPPPPGSLPGGPPGSCPSSIPDGVGWFKRMGRSRGQGLCPSLPPPSHSFPTSWGVGCLEAGSGQKGPGQSGSHQGVGLCPAGESKWMGEQVEGTERKGDVGRMRKGALCLWSLCRFWRRREQVWGGEGARCGEGGERDRLLAFSAREEFKF